MSLECMRTIFGIRTFLSDRALNTFMPFLSVPWYTRMYVNCPKVLSSSLKARPTKGRELYDTSLTGASLFLLSRAMFSTSEGLGRKSQTASSMG
jgi:hypothetical protein